MEAPMPRLRHKQKNPDDAYLIGWDPIACILMDGFQPDPRELAAKIRKHGYIPALVRTYIAEMLEGKPQRGGYLTIARHSEMNLAAMTAMAHWMSNRKARVKGAAEDAYEETAEKFNCSASTIKRRVKRYWGSLEALDDMEPSDFFANLNAIANTPPSASRRRAAKD
jgi:hypothetical protein